MVSPKTLSWPLRSGQPPGTVWAVEAKPGESHAGRYGQGCRGHGGALLGWEDGGSCGSVVYWGVPFTNRTLMIATYSVGNIAADKSGRPDKGPLWRRRTWRWKTRKRPCITTPSSMRKASPSDRDDLAPWRR